MRRIGFFLGSRGLDAPRKHVQDEDGDERRQALLVARARYAGLDRFDLWLCAKEACRPMSKPWDNDWVRFKRNSTYSVHAPELVVEFGFEELAGGGIVVCTDRDLGRTTRHSSVYKCVRVLHRRPRCQILEHDAGYRRAIVSRSRGRRCCTGRPRRPWARPRLGTGLRSDAFRRFGCW